jgi:hypothetical protein
MFYSNIYTKVSVAATAPLSSQVLVVYLHQQERRIKEDPEIDYYYTSKEVLEVLKKGVLASLTESSESSVGAPSKIATFDRTKDRSKRRQGLLQSSKPTDDQQERTLS